MLVDSSNNDYNVFKCNFVLRCLPTRAVSSPPSLKYKISILVVMKSSRTVQCISWRDRGVDAEHGETIGSVAGTTDPEAGAVERRWRQRTPDTSGQWSPHSVCSPLSTFSHNRGDERGLERELSFVFISME